MVDTRATTPLLAHIEYWQNRLLYERLYEALARPAQKPLLRRWRANVLLQHVSREEVNALPIRRYEGPVHVIAAPGELAPAMDDILQETLVGFDTETRPAFRPGESYPPSLAQVATARAVYLFQVQRADIAAAVARMLSEEHIVKAGVGMADDLKSLKKVVAFHEKSIADRRHRWRSATA